ATYEQSRTMVVAAVVACLLAAMPLAFRMRHLGTRPSAMGDDFRSSLRAFGTRPEQTLFFASLLLAPGLILVGARSGMITLLLGLEGLVVFVFALMVKERSFRLSGLGLLIACVGKIFFVDVWGMETRDKIITFIAVGAVLVTVAFLWSKHRE